MTLNPNMRQQPQQLQYLMVENPGEAPLSGLTLWGATTKDPNADDHTIGMFGSGTKHAVLVCLRRGIYPTIYSGKDKLEFHTSGLTVGETAHKEVLYAINGKAMKSTGATLAFGQHDWGEHFDLALREFVSNALDEVGGQAGKIKVGVVDSAQVRARAGYTRIFVPWAMSKSQGEEMLQSFLGNWFLHFRKDGSLPDKAGPLPKHHPGPAQFFRRGVLIRTWSKQDEASIYDYNFTSLTLDEARTADDWKLQYEAAVILRNKPDLLAECFLKVAQNPQAWEAKLSSYGLVPYWMAAEDKEAMKSAMAKVLPPGVVVTENAAGAQLAANKGRQALVVSNAWVELLDKLEGPTLARELGASANKGMDLCDPTPEMLAMVEKWNELAHEAGLARPDGMFPQVQGFHQHPTVDQGKRIWGQCLSGDGEGKIILNMELSGELLEQTVIEELCHWHSMTNDFTREFQEWLIRLVARTITKGKEIVA